MHFTQLTSLLGPFVTALSVIFAVYSYRKNEARQLFARFRLKILDIRQTVERLDMMLSDSTFIELGSNIGKELQILMTPLDSGQAIATYLQDQENHSYILQCFHLGLRNSESFKRSAEMRESLERAPYEFREVLPVTAAILVTLNTIITRTARDLLSTEFMDSHFDPTQSENYQNMTTHWSKYTKAQDCFREISIIIAGLFSVGLKNIRQKRITQSSSLIRILTDAFLSLQDEGLRKESSRQIKLVNQIRKITSTDGKMTDDLLPLFRLVQQAFDRATWDNIVAEIRTLEDTVK